MTMPLKTMPATRSHWFSSNPDRAWAENFVLAYTPVWIVLTAVFTTVVPLDKINDAVYLLFGSVVGGSRCG